jgi:hypothetical protein
MGDGEDIRADIRDAAAEFGVGRHIHDGTSMRHASWSLQVPVPMLDVVRIAGSRRNWGPDLPPAGPHRLE